MKNEKKKKTKKKKMLMMRKNNINPIIYCVYIDYKDELWCDEGLLFTDDHGRDSWVFVDLTTGPLDLSFPQSPYFIL